MRRVALTTIDNPFDPFEEFEDWLVFDTENGHHSTSLLARLTFTSEEISEKDQNLAVEAAIDEIVKYNVSGIHRKLVKES